MKRNNIIKLIGNIILAITPIVIGCLITWGLTCLVVWAICLCFGFHFSLLIATGIYFIFILIKAIF